MTADTPPVGDHVSRLFGRDALYMLLWAGQLLGAAAVTPAVTRLLGQGQFGTVSTANAVMQVLYVLAGFELQTAIQRQYERVDGHRDAHRLVSLTMLLTTVTTALALVTVPLWDRPLGLAGDPGSLRLAVVWAGMCVVTSAGLALLRSQDRLLAFATVSLLQSVVAEVTSLALVALRAPTAHQFLLGQVLAQVAAALLAIALAPPGRLRWGDRRLAASALRFALPLVPAALGSFGLASADRLLVQGFLGADAVARYQITYNIASMPMLLLYLLSTAWMPRVFALSGADERVAVLAASRDALYRLLMPVLIGLALGTPILLRLWAPSGYRPDGLLLAAAFVTLTAIPNAAQLAVARVLLAEGATAAIAVATLVAGVGNILANLVLIPRIGLVGAGLSTLAGYAALHALQAVAARRAGVPRATVRGDARVRYGLIGTSALVLLAVWVPTDRVFLAVRGVAVVITVVVFARMLRALARRPADARATAADLRHPSRNFG